MIWWEWTTYGGGDDCYNYTPKGKPAEKLLRKWFRQKSRKLRNAQRAPARIKTPPPLDTLESTDGRQ